MIGRRRGRTLPVVIVALAAVPVLLLGACSGDGGTTEVAGDEDVEGPLPTAPEGGASSGSGGGDVDVQALIARIDGLTSETDLCRLLTGQALAAVTGADIDLTSLLSDPSSFTQLFASLDRLFGHMTTIAPPDAAADLATMQGVWAGLSALDPRAADAEQRSAALIAGPEVQQAQSDLGVWVQSNCAGSRS